MQFGAGLESDSDGPLFCITGLFTPGQGIDLALHPVCIFFSSLFLGLGKALFFEYYTTALQYNARIEESPDI